MRKNAVNRCLRIAMGLTQKQVGEKAGVTSTSIARYEDGAENMTVMCTRNIEWAYKEMFEALDEMTRAKVKLASNALLLLEASSFIEKVDCLQSILYSTSMLLKEETKSMRFGLKNQKED